MPHSQGRNEGTREGMCEGQGEQDSRDSRDSGDSGDNRSEKAAFDDQSVAGPPSKTIALTRLPLFLASSAKRSCCPAGTVVSLPAMKRSMGGRPLRRAKLSGETLAASSCAGYSPSCRDASVGPRSVRADGRLRVRVLASLRQQVAARGADPCRRRDGRPQRTAGERPGESWRGGGA